MAPAGFESAIPASERPQTHALDRAATWISMPYIRTFIKVGRKLKKERERENLVNVNLKGYSVQSCTVHKYHSAWPLIHLAIRNWTQPIAWSTQYIA